MDSSISLLNVPYSKVFRNIKVLISNWLLNSKISQLETLKLIEVLVNSFSGSVIVFSELVINTLGLVIDIHIYYIVFAYQ